MLMDAGWMQMERHEDQRATTSKRPHPPGSIRPVAPSIHQGAPSMHGEAPPHVQTEWGGGEGCRYESDGSVVAVTTADVISVVENQVWAAEMCWESADSSCLHLLEQLDLMGPSEGRPTVKIKAEMIKGTWAHAPTST